MSNQPMDSDYFSGEATTKAELARVAIGDGSDGSLKVLEGKYLYSVQEEFFDKDERKVRLLHAIELRHPVGENEAYLVWGNAQIDKHLPCFAPGTKVHLEYKGTQKLDGGRTMKLIDVITSKSAVRVPNPFIGKGVATETPF